MSSIFMVCLFFLKPLILRFFIFQLLYAAFYLLHDLLGLLGRIRKERFCFLILCFQSKLFQTRLSTF
ncbi:Uncharacterised protein [Mycobacterium tuberculosis]|nr:Uncharacterised protein [Mycobacterium tuberculosis]